MLENCGFCSESPYISACLSCGKAACKSHTSMLDDTLCQNCESADTDFSEEPLIDTAGVRHKGRKITMMGERLLTSAAQIASLSDKELSEWIRTYTVLIHEAESTVQHRSVVKGILVMEKDERDHANRKSLIRLRVSARAMKKAASGGRKKKTDEERLLELLVSSGVTPEKLEGIAKNLKRKQ